MAKLDGFTPEVLKEVLETRKEPLRNNVIKNPVFQNSEPVKISPKKVNAAHTGNSGAHSAIKVSPLLENGQIVGVLAECGCGQKTRILFEYESV